MQTSLLPRINRRRWHKFHAGEVSRKKKRGTPVIRLAQQRCGCSRPPAAARVSGDRQTNEQTNRRRQHHRINPPLLRLWINKVVLFTINKYRCTPCPIYRIRFYVTRGNNVEWCRWHCPPPIFETDNEGLEWILTFIHIVMITRNVEGIYDNPVTWKSRLTVTQGHWKRKH